MEPKTDQSPRRYKSTRRAQQAEQTRADIVLAAARLFGRAGWAGTTLTAIAEEASVSVETIYSGFRTKKALLNPAMDVAIVGDAEPVPFVQRAEYLRLAALPPEQRLRQGLEILARSYRTANGMWLAMLEAATSDSDVAMWCDQHEERRRQTIGEFLDMVFERPCPAAWLDEIWVVASREVYQKLISQRDWSHDQWLEWITDVVRRRIGGFPTN